MLGEIERAAAWWIGDWWVYGEHRNGERVAILESEDWTGPNFQTRANCGAVVKKFETSRRRKVLSFIHHAEVGHLLLTRRGIGFLASLTKRGRPA
jgi:hypothetical protein